MATISYSTLFSFTIISIFVQIILSDSDWLQNCNLCYCNWNSGKKTADCKNKALTNIPHELSNELQVLDLSYNNIPELRREEFQDANLLNLHKIFMRNCTIQEINRDALKNLAILIELDLSHNKIKELHAGSFNGLAKLRNLVMNYNEIEVLENYLFADLHFLARVEFKNNNLKRIEVHSFGPLPILSSVYLEDNSLTTLRTEIFARTPKLIHLSLAQNPWNCTCELQEFRDFAIAKRLYTPPTDCNEPRHLSGKLWTEIPSENFACRPRILGSIRTFLEAQSDNITLPCRIEGSPRPNVTWSYNKRSINLNDRRLKVLNSIEQNRYESNILTSELRIYGVRASDKGAYTCVANNRGGKAEAEFQLLVNGHYFDMADSISGTDTAIGASVSETQSNILLIMFLIVATILLFLIVVVFVICWYCRRVKTYQKDTTMMSENGLISSKLDKQHHNGSMLEGSVIMEMQKSLLTEVNPVEKPPRRNELENMEGSDEGHDMKKTLLDETQFGNHHQRFDEETQSIALSDTTPRSRHTYVDDSYGTNLPPDLLAFPARAPPMSPSMQSSQSNIHEQQQQIIYGIRSPPLASPVYTHMSPQSIYGTTTTISTPTPNGFMTLQHPKSRNLALIAATNNRHHQMQQHQLQQQHQQQQKHQQQQQTSPFVAAPVIYSPATTVVMKQGYMTIPRKPRVPSWAPSTSLQQQHTSQLMNDFQSPTSPNPSETGTATTAELQSEPVYDNLGLRTTAGGNSTLNLHKPVEQAMRYNMRDRPLPATPSLTSVASNVLLQQDQTIGLSPIGNTLLSRPTTPTTSSASAIAKIYEPIHDIMQQQQQQQQHQQQQQLQKNSQYEAASTKIWESEPLYGSSRHNNTDLSIITTGIIKPTVTNCSPGEGKISKIPPRPPPKPKKKLSVSTTRAGQGSTSQLFDDEGEDGTEV